MDEVRSWGVEKEDYPGKATRKKTVVHSCGHDLSFPGWRVGVPTNAQEPEKETVSQKGKLSTIVSQKVF